MPNVTRYPDIKYRVAFLDDEPGYYVQWLLGSVWITVFGPSTYGDAFQHLHLLKEMPL